jgi:hypothetical protein
VASKVIPLALAKQTLIEIDKLLADQFLLIGGIAVNHFVKARDSHDIDLICTHNQSVDVLKSFPHDQWDIQDRNDDPERPAYILENKKDPKIVLSFGPKIVERGAYDYLDWDALAEGAVPLTYQNVELEHIAIPNAANLAYSKLISFFLRKDPAKKKQDLIDFLNLSNLNEFSYARFMSMLERFGAESLVQENAASFLDAYSSAKVTSPLFRLGDLFSKATLRPQKSRFVYGSAESMGRILDAAIYFHDKSTFAADEIRSAVEGKRLFPVKLLYRTEEGVKSWLELCDSPLYSFYVSSYNNFAGAVSSLVESIREKSAAQGFNLISLGVGDGKKELLLVKALLQVVGQDGKLFYHPVDVSLSMIERTATQLAANATVQRDIDRLAVKPVVGDFLGINSMDPIYGSEANIFAILGNTIGNGPERELFGALKDAIRPGDFVLIEIDTNQAGVNSDFSTSSENRRVDLAPLRAAGYSVSESDLEYLVVKDKNTHSVVPQTVSIVAECELKRLPKPIRARTSVIHHYQLEPFAAFAADWLNMTAVHQSENGGVGLVLLHKGAAS